MWDGGYLLSHSLDGISDKSALSSFDIANLSSELTFAKFSQLQMATDTSEEEEWGGGGRGEKSAK